LGRAVPSGKSGRDCQHPRGAFDRAR